MTEKEIIFIFNDKFKDLTTLFKNNLNKVEYNIKNLDNKVNDIDARLRNNTAWISAIGIILIIIIIFALILFSKYLNIGDRITIEPVTTITNEVKADSEAKNSSKNDTKIENTNKTTETTKKGFMIK